MPDRKTRPAAVVIDGDPRQRELLCGLLRQADLDPLPFARPEAALAALNPAAAPALVVTGLTSPGLDGWQFCRLLRSPEYAAWNRSPILLVSGGSPGDCPERNAAAAAAGADAILPVSVDETEFVTRVRALLQGREAGRRPAVLFVAETHELVRRLADAFASHGYRADTVPAAREAEQALARTAYDLVVLDDHLPDGTGEPLLDAVRARRPACVCVVLTDNPEPERALDWMKRGASAYLRKPCAPHQLLELCAQARRERMILRAEELLAARQRELRDSEQRYRGSFDSLSDAAFVHELDEQGRPGRFLEVNEAACRRLGYSREELLRLTPREITERAEYERLARWRGELGDRGNVLIETIHVAKDGRRIPVEGNIRRITYLDRPAALSVSRDITERKRTEERLRESEERHRNLFMEMQEGFALHEIVCDESGRPCDYRYLEVNPAFERATGIPRERWLGRTVREVLPNVEDLWIQRFGEVALTGRPTKFENYVRELDQYYDVVAYSPRRGQFAVIALNVTERRRMELNLQRRDALLEAAVRASGLLLTSASPAETVGDLVRLLGAASRQDRAYYFSWQADAPTGRVFISLRHEWVAEAIVPQQGNPQLQKLPFDEVAPYSCERLRQGLEVCALVRDLPPSEREVLEPQGILSFLLMPIMVNGSPEGFLGFDNCRTEYAWTVEERAVLAMVAANLGAAVARSRAEAEKEKLQAQLNQAQKMESVGRLAGGVAHDFNNMLQAILGNTALALLDLPPDSPARESLDEVQKCAQRSADLTRQLLAFARKQTIAPKVLDLNDTVTRMLKMLRRLIGEDVDLAWLPGANLGAVNMDPSQVDQILANLCVNARDAIGGGPGRVTIETANAAFDETYAATHPEARSGEYVRLAVSDNGCGMSPEVKAHLFEPFYTTKEVGQGTGLGLATVYGIVKQNNGFLSVYSEPGRGTTFQVHLPRHAAPAACPAPEAATQPLCQGHETILLVEDEPAILSLSQRILERLGYRVLVARTPGEALRLACEHDGEIHLLLTDVVMPEMNGRDLARNLLRQFPNLKRLFMSGYTANVIAHHGVLDPGVDFIQKPFSVQALADKVRETLSRD